MFSLVSAEIILQSIEKKLCISKIEFDVRVVVEISILTAQFISDGVVVRFAVLLISTNLIFYSLSWF